MWLYKAFERGHKDIPSNEDWYQCVINRPQTHDWRGVLRVRLPPPPPAFVLQLKSFRATAGEPVYQGTELTPAALKLEGGGSTPYYPPDDIASYPLS